MVEKVPATNEPMAEIESAVPDLPICDNAYPSFTITTDDASPGSFNKIAVIEPPYWVP